MVANCKVMHLIQKERYKNLPKTFDAPTRALAATSDAMPALRNTAVE